MAGKFCPVRQDGNQSERNLLRPCSCPTCAIRSGKSVPEKTLTISGADRFTRRVGACRLHAIFVNRLCINDSTRKNCQALHVHAPKTFVQSTAKGLPVFWRGSFHSATTPALRPSSGRRS